jgi:hypothetical protein
MTNFHRKSKWLGQFFSPRRPQDEFLKKISVVRTNIQSQEALGQLLKENING